ncbi:MAG: YggS family pyridoxal phosphate-dependent enzyme [Myxococcota bacterium]
MTGVAQVEANLQAVRRRIEIACERAGRDPATVRLIAVSKRHPPEAILAAHAAGQDVFGENYAQELVEKAEALTGVSVRFQFIGRLQRNKAKDVVRVGAEIAKVDSLRLAREIDKRSRAAGVVTPIHLQVNVARETQKGGCGPEEARPLLLEIRANMPALEVRGLMTIPPLGDARMHFRALRELGEALGLRGLSMGMSADLEEAIAEGSTEVRVGTAIFGPRPA